MRFDYNSGALREGHRAWESKLDAGGGADGNATVKTVDDTATLRPDLSLVFPIFDEADNVAPLLAAAHEIASRLTPEYEIILVDDGSRDGSALIIDEWCRKHSRSRVVRHASNTGYGAALRSGLREARGNWIFFSDADLQFDLNEIELLLAHTHEYDIVAGYRARRSDPLHRRAIARAWGAIVHLLFGLRVRDIDCAFKVFRRDVIEAIPIESLGAFINTEILVRARARDCRIHQVPVSHHERRYGVQTGAKPRVILRAMLELGVLFRDLRRPQLDSFARSIDFATRVREPAWQSQKDGAA